jgi:hypothetical protein
MKYLLIFIAAMAFVQSSCKVFSTLTSGTYIDPEKTFVLGEGQHGSYVATVKNTAKSDVEVILTDAENKSSSLGILKFRQSETYRVAANNTVRFVNLGNRQAALAIKIQGETSLSMGYQGKGKD